jgi:predicted lipoprotein with Yx(FWY)xxD motif
MKRLLIAGAVVAVAIVAGIVIAVATGGGGGDSSSPGASPSNTGNGQGHTQGHTQGVSHATVSARQIGGAGSVLVDATGQALYTNDQETEAKVLCVDACLSFWTPLTASGGAPKGNSITGTLGTVNRPDGSKQVTYKGKPLYSFYLDAPGKVGGDGFDDAFAGRQFTWHVEHGDQAASTSGGQSSSPSGPRGY